MGSRPAAWRWIGAASVVATIVGAGVPARAEGDDQRRASARELATDGAKAFDEGRWADAIDRFTRAEALYHAPPHLLYVARASAKLGKLVQAHETYVKITREDLPKGAPKAFVDAQRAAATEQQALEPRLAKLTIVVKGEGAAKATVTLDGVDVPPALIGVAHSADPGAHVLRARSPAATSDDVRVDLTEGATKTATIELTHAVAAAPAAATVTTPAEPRRTKTPLAAWIALGVGVVGVGAGTFFVIQNHSKRGDADALCPNGACPASRRADIEALDHDADNAATYSWIAYGVGAAGLVAGGVLMLVGRSSSAPQQGHVGPWLGAGAAGVEGRF